MQVEQEILSNVTIFSKYAKYVPELQRRETWDEICDRYELMMVEKYPSQVNAIANNMELVRAKKVLPSMRMMQFAGKPVMVNHARGYNCSYLPVDHYKAFSETMFLLLSGTGVGYSVQFHHVEKLPHITRPTHSKRYVVSDDIAGWADAVKVLMKAYLGASSYKPRFDFSDIRPKGARLITSGGKAPGPEPLKRCLFNIEQLLDRKENGDKLTPIECHDILCYIADAVLAGGIRRAAMISLFSLDDNDMLTAKYGNWWESNAQRGRANNSAVLVRSRLSKEDFDDLWKKIELSRSGEPGMFFTNNSEWGANPCLEVSLRPYQMCNLCEVNVSNVTSQDDLNERVAAAAFFGTLQAGFTDFYYLRDIWRKTCEKEALIGVGMTGIASGHVLKLDLKQAAKVVKDTNERVAAEIGINRSARCTVIKPSGTTSCVLGTSSGIHAWHNDYYIRRQRIGKNEALYSHFLVNHPELLEEDQMNPAQAIIAIPQKAPHGSITRHESALHLLDRVGKFTLEWIHEGHRKGDNKNNVSTTVSIRDHEWQEVGEWIWNHRNEVTGLSVLPFDGGTYTQAPFQDISEREYLAMAEHLSTVDLSKVIEVDDTTDQAAEAACAGGACEVVFA